MRSGIHASGAAPVQRCNFSFSSRTGISVLRCSCYWCHSLSPLWSLHSWTTPTKTGPGPRTSATLHTRGDRYTNDGGAGSREPRCWGFLLLLCQVQLRKHGRWWSDLQRSATVLDVGEPYERYSTRERSPSFRRLGDFIVSTWGLAKPPLEKCLRLLC